MAAARGQGLLLEEVAAQMLVLFRLHGEGGGTWEGAVDMRRARGGAVAEEGGRPRGATRVPKWK